MCTGALQGAGQGGNYPSQSHSMESDDLVADDLGRDIALMSGGNGQRSGQQWMNPPMCVGDPFIPDKVRPTHSIWPCQRDDSSVLHTEFDYQH